MGEYFVERLKGLQQRHPCVVSVRGLGLLVGMELAIDGKPIVQDCLEEGILINCTMDRVLRFVPPLIILKEEIDLLINRLDGIFKKRTA
jgi:acetylornithine/succinyldiaminopimelate/putrescine aminotransferase